MDKLPEQSFPVNDALDKTNKDYTDLLTFGIDENNREVQKRLKTNATDIATNVTDIATNTTDIAASGFVDRGDPAANDYEVGDLPADGAWHDLDLGTDVGVPSGAKAVLMKVIVRHDDPNKRIRLRKNGNSNVYNTGIVRTQAAGVTVDSDVIVSLGTNAIIEYEASSGTFAVLILTVKGWWV